MCIIDKLSTDGERLKRWLLLRNQEIPREALPLGNSFNECPPPVGSDVERFRGAVTHSDPNPELLDLVCLQ